MLLPPPPFSEYTEIDFKTTSKKHWNGADMYTYMYRGFNLDTLSVSKGNSGWNQSVVKVGCHLCSHNHKTLVKTFAST